MHKQKLLNRFIVSILLIATSGSCLCSASGLFTTNNDSSNGYIQNYVEPIKFGNTQNYIEPVDFRNTRMFIYQKEGEDDLIGNQLTDTQTLKPVDFNKNSYNSEIQKNFAKSEKQKEEAKDSCEKDEEKIETKNKEFIENSKKVEKILGETNRVCDNIVHSHVNYVNNTDYYRPRVSHRLGRRDEFVTREEMETLIHNNPANQTQRAEDSCCNISKRCKKIIIISCCGVVVVGFGSYILGHFFGK